MDIAHSQEESGSHAGQSHQGCFREEQGGHPPGGKSQLKEGAHLGGAVFEVEAKEEGRQEEGRQEEEKTKPQEKLAEVDASTGGG